MTALTAQETDALRRLAGELGEIAALPVQNQKRALWRRLNRLEKVRPLVWINEVCWEQITGPEMEMQVQSDPFLRGIEWSMRATLYQWKHFPGDMIVDDFLYCPIAIGSTGFGLETRAVSPKGIDKGACDYLPVIRDAKDVEKIQLPRVSVDAEETGRRYELMSRVFAGLLRIEKTGVMGTWFAPWDRLVTWYGIQELYTDMVDKPELVRAAIARMVDAQLHEFDQFERMGLLSLNNRNCRVGSGGLGITDELPQKDFDPAHVRMIDMWGNSTPQIFSAVSPAMHWEFALKHELRILERFGLNCYGCCEPLHHKIDMLRRVPRLRRISMSPFVNIERGAAAIGGDFIYSAKPNPSVLAWDHWSPDQARTYLREILDKTRGLHVEIILKDVHTLRNEPQRLWEWEKIAMELVQQYG